MDVLVMGAGALGSVAGGLLADAGHRVTLVGRAAHMEAIRDGGLHISGIWGEHHVTNIAACATGLPPRPTAPPPEVVLLAVKSYDTAAAMAQLREYVGPDTLVCSYQNGLGNAETVAGQVGWARTVGARVIYGARVPAPGQVEVTVIAQPTALGVYHPSAPEARVRALAATMEAAGLPTVFTDRIATVLWSKVAYNSALNPLSALLDVPYGALAETEHTRTIMREVIDELYRVAEAMGTALEPSTPSAYLDLFYSTLLPPTAAHYASMREDFQRHRRTEIDALNGALVRFGAERGVPCPTNHLLTRLVHAREHALGVPDLTAP